MWTPSVTGAFLVISILSSSSALSFRFRTTDLFQKKDETKTEESVVKNTFTNPLTLENHDKYKDSAKNDLKDLEDNLVNPELKPKVSVNDLDNDTKKDESRQALMLVKERSKRSPGGKDSHELDFIHGKGQTKPLKAPVKETEDVKKAAPNESKKINDDANSQ